MSPFWTKMSQTIVQNIDVNVNILDNPRTQLVSSPPDTAGVLTPPGKMLIYNESQSAPSILISGGWHGYVLAPVPGVPARSKRAASDYTGGASAPPNHPDRRPRRASALRAVLSAGCARAFA